MARVLWPGYWPKFANCSPSYGIPVCPVLGSASSVTTIRIRREASSFEEEAQAMARNGSPAPDLCEAIYGLNLWRSWRVRLTPAFDNFVQRREGSTTTDSSYPESGRDVDPTPPYWEVELSILACLICCVLSGRLVGLTLE